MRGALGLARVGTTGYCYGGRYAFRLGAHGADAVFAAHPSLLDDGEIAAVKVPVSVAAAENDPMMSPARRAQVEAGLGKTGLAYSLALYGGNVARLRRPRERDGRAPARRQGGRLLPGREVVSTRGCEKKEKGGYHLAHRAIDISLKK